MNASHQERKPKDLSWPMLLVIAGVIVGSLSLLRYNVLYTEGEVMQGLFTLLVGVVAACVLIGFYRRTIAVWCIAVLGGSLLLWQSYQTRKWAVIHEEIVAIVRFAEEVKVRTGRYPVNLDGYTFKSAEVKSHVQIFGSEAADEFRISYFMNQPGVSYWYSSRTGFGYYPD